MSGLRKRLWESGWGLLPLRLMIGFGFAAHGWAKLSRGPEHFAVILSALGVPQPHLMAWVTPRVELIGGLSLMAGAFVVPLTLLLCGGAAHRSFHGSSAIRIFLSDTHSRDSARRAVWPIGYKMDLLYLAGLLTLALGGAGKLSIDDKLQIRREKAGKTEDSDRLSIGPLKLKLRI
jgi:putative oxidoreductase